jgi:hypothetical protein
MWSHNDPEEFDQMLTMLERLPEGREIVAEVADDFEEMWRREEEPGRKLRIQYLLEATEHPVTEPEAKPSGP